MGMEILRQGWVDEEVDAEKKGGGGGEYGIGEEETRCTDHQKWQQLSFGRINRWPYA